LGPPPKKIRINHDDYYASLVGRTRDGRQFFITQPFVPYLQDFVARYLFDQAGTCIDVKVQDLGVRATGEPPGNALLNNDMAEQIQRTFLLELGETELCDIEVIPFSHNEYGTTFGLIINAPEEPDDNHGAIRLLQAVWIRCTLVSTLLVLEFSWGKRNRRIAWHA
jgi:hypothetical protein